MSKDALVSACDFACRLHPADPAAGPATMDRRAFVVRSAIFAAAAALAACGTGDVTSPDLSSSSTVKLSAFPTLANVGGVATMGIQGIPVAVVRTGETTFITLSRVCPHQGETVNPVSSGFECPLHGAQFNIDGVWVGGQHTSNLHQYPTTYDAANQTLTIG